MMILSVGPPTRWSATRRSPELRIYRSLPSRHRNYRERSTEPASKDDGARFKLGCSRESDLDAREHGVEDNAGDSKNADEPTNERSASIHERTKREKSIAGRSEEEVSSTDVIRFKRNERSAKRDRPDEQEDPAQEPASTPARISLIKPPRILAKLISTETKPSTAKHGERKSNIPIFRRSSKEFEDIRSPQESPKRSLIPQR